MLKDTEYMKAAIYQVSDEVNKKGWHIKYLKDVSDLELKNAYETLIGEKLKKEMELEKRVKELEKEITYLKKELQDISYEIMRNENVIKTIYEDINAKLNIVEDAKDLKGNLTLTATDLSTMLSKIIEKVSKYSELQYTTIALEKLKNTFERPVHLTKESYDVIKNVVLEISLLLEDFYYQVEKFTENFEKVNHTEKLLEEKVKLYKKSFAELTTLKKEIEKTQEELLPYLKKAYLIYMNETVLNKMGDIKNMKFTKASLTKLYFTLRTFRKLLSGCKNYGCEAYKEFSRVVDKLEWVEDYRNFEKNIVKLKKNTEKLVKSFKNEYENLQQKWKAAFKLSLNGIAVVPEELKKMNELLTVVYDGEVSPPLGIALRSNRNLLDAEIGREFKGLLKDIDKNLFTMLQTWKRKPKHYFLRWVLNSVIVAGLVAIITTFVTAIAAYPFSRMKFWGRRYGIMTLLLIQMFPAIMYMVALYGMLSFLGKILPWLGLDSLGGLIFVYLGNIAFNMFLIKGFYDTIPSSLEESAMIDGATRFQTFWKIIIPLARPILAVVVILTFMGTFNEFVLARIILQDVKNYTYALGLWSFSTGPYEMEWGLFTAAALLGMLPMVILFLSLQRFLISGLTKGSVKG